MRHIFELVRHYLEIEGEGDKKMSFKSLIGSMSSFFGLEAEIPTENFTTPTKQPESRFEQPTREKPTTIKKQEKSMPQAHVNKEKKKEIVRKKPVPTPANPSFAGQGLPTARVDQKVVPLVGERKKTKQSNANPENTNKIMVFEPRAYSEATMIAKHILSGKSVLVNFHLMEEPQARRVVDFLTGTVYAEDGDIKRVADEMFLCTPPTVEIEGTTKSLEEYNQFDFNQLSL